MRIAAVALALWVGAGSLALADDVAPPPEPGSLAAFEAYVADANAGYATNRFAVMKAVDALYLKPGETAWLMDGGRRLSPAAPANYVPSVSYDADGARYTFHGGDSGIRDRQAIEATQSQDIELGDGVTIRIAQAQIAPGQLGLRVAAYDENAEAARNFTGLSFYPFNPDLVIEARVEVLASAEGFDFQTSRGWLKRFYRVAEAVFSVGGAEYRLPLYAASYNPDEIDGFSTFFTDGTTGKTTYEAGRYMDWGFEMGAMPSTILVNFNEAYNPLCARSPHWNCPYAIDHLAFDVAAGEMKPEDKAH